MMKLILPLRPEQKGKREKGEAEVEWRRRNMKDADHTSLPALLSPSSISFSSLTPLFDPLDPTAEPSAGLDGGSLAPAGQLVHRESSPRGGSPHHGTLCPGRYAPCSHCTTDHTTHSPILGFSGDPCLILLRDPRKSPRHDKRVRYVHQPYRPLPATKMSPHRSANSLPCILSLATTSWHAGRVVRAQRWAGRYRF